MHGSLFLLAVPVAAEEALVNPASGKCLDVYNPDGLHPSMWADETPVHLFSCNHATGQEWILQDGTLINPASGKCLDIYNPLELPPDEYEDETKVQLLTCKGNANQQWALVSQGAQTQQLMNLPSGKCLDIWYGNPDDDTRVQLFTCGDKPNQMWRFGHVNSLAKSGEPEQALVNPASGKCLDVTNPDGLPPSRWADETPVHLFSCNHAKGQEWILQDGTLVNPASGKCLDIYNPLELPPDEYEDETKVQLLTCKGNANQQWAFVSQGPQIQQLMNLPSGKCLDIYQVNPDDDTQVGWGDDTPVQLFTCGDKPNQMWRFGRVNSQVEVMV